MASKNLPFNKEQLEEIIKKYPTPFHIYDEKAIRENARKLIKAFDWIPEFKEYFAVKANPNPFLMKILKDEGFGTDCSSLPELLLSEKVGVWGEDIMFTSNNTPVDEFKKATDLGAIINLDDITHIDYLDTNVGLPALVCFRFNPGPLRAGNTIIGHPEDAKYGFTKDQLFEGYEKLRDRGIKRFGLHSMVASNELDPKFFVETARMLIDLVIEISKKLNVKFEFINIGGGIGIPYELGQEAVDLDSISQGIKAVYDEKIKGSAFEPLKIFMENGRMITGPYGYLVTKVIHTKSIYKEYLGMDSSMANLMRPGLYGAYHHITIMGKEDAPLTKTYDVVGSLCENNDKFAIDRKLPETVPGDIAVIHDTGAHGFAMGFNYNGKLRSAELLLKENGEIEEIRRAETIDDYFSTLDMSKL